MLVRHPAIADRPRRRGCRDGSERAAGREGVRRSCTSQRRRLGGHSIAGRSRSRHLASLERHLSRGTKSSAGIAPNTFRHHVRPAHDGSSPHPRRRGRDVMEQPKPHFAPRVQSRSVIDRAADVIDRARNACDQPLPLIAQASSAFARASAPGAGALTHDCYSDRCDCSHSAYGCSGMRRHLPCTESDCSRTRRRVACSDRDCSALNTRP